VQFVGDFLIDTGICDRLVELHRVCDRRGLAVRGSVRNSAGTKVDPEKKDSFDVNIDGIPLDLGNEYGIPAYFAELQRCCDQYMQQHPLLMTVGLFRITEAPNIQHYRPGGGFKMPHFERSGYDSTTRMLVWMTYLNDVTDGGGTRFVYQQHTFDARRGSTLIWPTDFTHTHVGVVSPSQHKYIITGWFNFVA